MLDQLGETEATVVIAKAFKAATQAGSYLYKQKNLQPTTHETGQREEHGHMSHTFPIQPQITQVNRDTLQLQPGTKPLYSQVVGTNTNQSATITDNSGHRGSTSNWRRGREASYSPFYRQTEGFELKQQRETGTKSHHNNTRTEYRPPYHPPATSQEMLPPRLGLTQDQPSSLLHLASPKPNTHPREPGPPKPSSSYTTRDQTNLQGEPQRRSDLEANTRTRNSTNTDLGRDNTTKQN